MNTEQPTETPPQPPVQSELTMVDLVVLTQLIERVAEKGFFKPTEFIQYGLIYKRLKDTTK